MKSFFILLLILPLTSWAMTPEERQARREELHRQMREKMLQSRSLENSERWLREMDRLMDDLVSDSLREIESMKNQGQGLSVDILNQSRFGVKASWEETKDGRVLTLAPDNQETKMDVQVLNNIITIKTELTKNTSVQKMTRTQLVPGDCDGDKVKMEGKDNQLILTFPWKNGAQNSTKERKPLNPQKGQVDV